MKFALKQLLYTSVISLTAIPRVYADGPNGLHMGQNWGWDHMLNGAPMMLISWVLILVLIVFFLARRKSDSGPTHESNNATAPTLQTLAERYAKGEIDKAEFNERKREISS